MKMINRKKQNLTSPNSLQLTVIYPLTCRKDRQHEGVDIKIRNPVPGGGIHFLFVSTYIQQSLASACIFKKFLTCGIQDNVSVRMKCSILKLFEKSYFENVSCVQSVLFLSYLKKVILRMYDVFQLKLFLKS